MAMGNGLRADVWEAFQQRFGPIRIWEIYGSTEGNMGLVNYVGRRGALGKMNCLLRVSVRVPGVQLPRLRLSPQDLCRHPTLYPRCCPPLSWCSSTWRRKSL